MEGKPSYLGTPFGSDIGLVVQGSGPADNRGTNIETMGKMRTSFWRAVEQVWQYEEEMSNIGMVHILDREYVEDMTVMPFQKPDGFALVLKIKSGHGVVLPRTFVRTYNMPSVMYSEYNFPFPHGAGEVIEVCPWWPRECGIACHP